jgi:hypothetical protein
MGRPLNVSILPVLHPWVAHAEKEKVADHVQRRTDCNGHGFTSLTLLLATKLSSSVGSPVAQTPNWLPHIATENSRQRW